MRGSGKQSRQNTDITSTHCQRIATKCPVIWSHPESNIDNFLSASEMGKNFPSSVRSKFSPATCIFATKLRGIGKRRERFGREIIKVGENGICEERCEKVPKIQRAGEELSGNDWRRLMEKEKES